MQYEQEAADLKSQIHSFRTQHEAAVFEVKQKEERIQHLLREIQNLVGINIHSTIQIKMGLGHQTMHNLTLSNTQVGGLAVVICVQLLSYSTYS
jgi:predicted sugar kinase